MSKPSNLSVLLLEDQGLVRAGMRALIQISEPHAQVEEVSSYQQAVEKLELKNFDIAFLDIDLGEEKNGLDVLNYIRSKDMITRAIMLSGNGQKETVMNCIKDGASGFILKDMNNDDVFRRALDVVFQGSIFLPANVIGKGGFSPATAHARPQLSAESLGITGRALEVLYYLCQGLPNKSIGRNMGIEEGTIRRDYVPKLFQILKVSRRTELVVEVARRGIVVPVPRGQAS